MTYFFLCYILFEFLLRSVKVIRYLNVFERFDIMHCNELSLLLHWQRTRRQVIIEFYKEDMLIKKYDLFVK